MSDQANGHEASAAEKNSGGNNNNNNNSSSNNHNTAATGNLDVAPQHTADSTTDTGASRRPRDARVVHLVLASMGVHAYHERVPLQIMDFAYRYTSAVLQDALLYADVSANTGGGSSSSVNPPSNITVDDLRMSIASRVNHQFNTSLPKEFLLDVAHERNRIALPPVDKGYGIRLPPEKYCLTGVNWELVDAEDFPLDEEEEGEGEGGGDGGGEGGDEDGMMEGVVSAESGGGGGGGHGGAPPGAVEEEDAQGEDDEMNMDDMFGGGDDDDDDDDDDRDGGGRDGGDGDGAAKDENMTDA
ncbi:transcription initiation factor [Peziza echinospora]|nr:transcription initiation factor [Peziza echinospora]